MMILVTGATGTIGSEVAKGLLERGAKVRALVRSPEKAEALKSAGAEVAQGSLEDTQSLEAALRGVEKVFLVSPAEPRQAELQGNLVTAAARAGVKHLVKISTTGAGHDSPVSLARLHAKIEDDIK